MFDQPMQNPYKANHVALASSNPPKAGPMASRMSFCPAAVRETLDETVADLVHDRIHQEPSAEALED